MLSVMKQHGRTILCCMTAVLIFAAVFCIRAGGRRGLIQIAYERALGDLTEEPESRADEEAVRAVAVRKPPEISFAYQKTYPDAAVCLNDMFLAKDADGALIAVEITDVLDGSGRSLLYGEDSGHTKKKPLQDTRNFRFPSVGIYMLTVKATDREKKTACAQYQIPVTSN